MVTVVKYLQLTQTYESTNESTKERSVTNVRTVINVILVRIILNDTAVWHTVLAKDTSVGFAESF